MKLMKAILGLLVMATTMVACKSPTYKKTKDGFPYTIFSDGKGEKIVAGNVIRFHSTSKLSGGSGKDSLLATTYGGDARWLPIPKDGPALEQAKFFLEARKGDSILLIQPVDSIMAKDPRAKDDPFLVANKGKQVKIWFKIVDVFKDEESVTAIREKEAITAFYKDTANLAQKQRDDAALQEYLKANNITAKPTPWGAYLQSVSAGNGAKAKLGQYLQVRYTGKHLSGEVFETNYKPDAPTLDLQLGVTQLITGFTDALQNMSKGEKATVYIPSVIGYGVRGGQPNEKGEQVIKPNESLIFELELVNITDSQPQPPPMRQRDTTRN